METKVNILLKNRITTSISILVALLLLTTNPLLAKEKKHKERQATQRTGQIAGFVVDDEFNEPLEKAVVTIPGTLISVLTDQQGNFKMKLVGGNYSIKVNYPGYFEKFYNVSVSDGIYTPMFIIKLKANATGREMQRKITSYENKHLFPQSIENLTTWQVAEQTGNPEFNMAFRMVPSVNLLSNGSGFSDSEIGFRGNDATHTSYAFNGILLNNPETGKVSPPLLSGLTDWAGQIQVTSGQAANLQSQTSSGGLVNVLSLAPHEKAGADVLAVYGNQGFLKTSAAVHSGLSKKGWASAFQVSRTAGDGRTQNTAFEQYGFFTNIQKEFNQFHTLVFNLNGVIQQHDRNFADSIGAYNRYGTKYNRQWGYLNEKPLSVSTNYGRSPLISLTHFWRPRVKTHITTQVFAQFDRSAQLSPEGKLINQSLDSIPRDANGHLLLDQVVNWNQGQTAAGMGVFRLPNTEGKFINFEKEGIAIQSATNSETRLGLRTIVTRSLTKQADFSASLNLEDYRANHFGAVSNLLGADGYTSYADINRPEGFLVENLFQYRFLTKYNAADKVNYSYLSEVQTGGVSMRVNYRGDLFYWFLAGSASLQNLIRTDYFNYPTTDLNRKAEYSLLPGGHAQTGFNFKFWKYHSVHLRAGYGSYQQRFTTLFPTTGNWKNTDAKNEQILDVELGYTIFSRKLKVEAVAYQTEISNRSMVRHTSLNKGDTLGMANGLAEVHRGVELKSSYKLTKNFQISVNGSLGDWEYSKNAQVIFYDAGQGTITKKEFALKGLKIANAPQFSLFAEAEYRWAHNFYVRLNYYRVEQIFAPINIYHFSELDFLADFSYIQAKVPKYDLIGFSGNYLLKFRKLPAVNLIFGGQNLLDTEYIEQSSTNIPEGNPGYTGNQVYYGMGRTWFAGVKVEF